MRDLGTGKSMSFFFVRFDFRLENVEGKWMVDGIRNLVRTWEIMTERLGFST